MNFRTCKEFYDPQPLQNSGLGLFRSEAELQREAGQGATNCRQHFSAMNELSVHSQQQSVCVLRTRARVPWPHIGSACTRNRAGLSLSQSFRLLGAPAFGRTRKDCFFLTWICLTRGGYALHLTHRTHRTL
jgi:hypothetical protein